MTIAQEGRRFSIAGNGSTTAFPFNRLVLANNELDVYLVDNATLAETLQVFNTDYTLAGLGNPGGVTVTFAVPPPTGKTVVLVGDTTLTQNYDPTDVGFVTAQGVEDALDREEIQIQELADALARTLQLSPGSSYGGSLVLPPPIPTYVLAWNNNGNALISAPPTVSDIVSGFQSNEWKFSNSTSPPPSSGQLRMNAAPGAGVNTIHLHYTTATGIDAKGLINALFVSGSILYVQQKDDSTVRHKFSIAGGLTDNGTYASIPVTWISGAGVYQNNKDLVLVHEAAGGGGGASNVTMYQTPVTGSANAITASAFLGGTLHYFRSAFANTGAATFNSRPIKLPDGTALIGGEIQPGVWYTLLDDGTNYTLIQSGAVI